MRVIAVHGTIAGIIPTVEVVKEMTYENEFASLTCLSNRQTNSRFNRSIG